MTPRRFVAAAKDRPRVVTVGLLVAVALHAALYDQVSLFPDVIGALDESRSAALTLYLAGGAVSLGVASFAGIVVVFALTQAGDRWRLLRLNGGTHLRDNWVSVLSVTLAGAFLSLAAALLAVTGHPSAAWWTFEFTVLWSGAAAVRLVWLLSRLLLVGEQVDVDAERPRPVDIRDRMRGTAR